MDIAALFPMLLPKALAWARSIAGDVGTRGSTLTPAGLLDARTVGVREPERIRVLIVDEIPLPLDADLRSAALQTGLLGDSTWGLTLGYAILIRQGKLSRRLLSHEYRHVAQYEQYSSFDEFLAAYLGSIVQVGYRESPFEKDARAYEIPDA